MSIERRGTKALEIWARQITQGYKGVSVANMTTSWRDGLAFCALIHSFRPDLIEFSSLKAENVFENNALAFRVAEQHLGIPALLDAEDMVESEVPDRLSILTYVSQYYQAFAAHGLTSPKKTLPIPVTAKNKAIETPPQPKTKTELKTDKVLARSSSRREVCVACTNPVFLAERLVVETGKLMHRTCFLCARCSAQLNLANYYETEKGEYCCETCPDEECSLSDSVISGSQILTSLNSDNDTDSSDESDSYSQNIDTNVGEFCKAGISDDYLALGEADSAVPKLRTVFLKGILHNAPSDDSMQLTNDSAVQEFYHHNFDKVSSTLIGPSLHETEEPAELPDLVANCNAKADVICPPEEVVLDTGQEVPLQELNVENTELSEITKQSSDLDYLQMLSSNPFDSQLPKNNDAEDIEIISTVSETIVLSTEDENYPESLNPFESEENFGSSESSKPDELSQQLLSTVCRANPFWSSDEEEGELGVRIKKIKPPRPPPPTLGRGVSPLRGGDKASILNPLEEVHIPRKRRPAPPPPPHSASGMPSHQDEVLNWKIQKDMLNQTIRNKAESGEWRRKKGPAPSRPIPQRRAIHKLPKQQVQLELRDIDIKQIELERQGVLLEKAIREKTETVDNKDEKCNFDIKDDYVSHESSGPSSLAAEEMILQLFELVNEKNNLFRRQTELMYLKREKRLEEEHADLEYQIRCLMLKPPYEKSEEDKLHEEMLIGRLIKVVEQRDEIINCLEMDRLRETQEDQSIAAHLSLYQERHIDNAGQEINEEVLKRKKKKRILKLLKKKKAKEKKDTGGEKDVDESEKHHKAKKKWF